MQKTYQAFKLNRDDAMDVVDGEADKGWLMIRIVVSG